MSGPELPCHDHLHDHLTHIADNICVIQHMSVEDQIRVRSWRGLVRAAIDSSSKPG